MLNRELFGRIEEVIEKHIRPSLEIDGGNIQLVDLRGNRLFVQLQGACSCCPHATETLKNSVEKVLQDLVDPNILVSAV